MTQRRRIAALRASAGLLGLSVIGSAFGDQLRLALVPATLALIVGVGAFTGDGASGFGVHAARAALAGLALASAGAVALDLRVEPTWLSAATVAAGALFVVSLAWIGVSGAWRRSLPRRWAWLLAAALPLGLLLDYLPARVAPGVFLQGWGWPVGAGLLALALARLEPMRLPRPDTSETMEPTNTSDRRPRG